MANARSRSRDHSRICLRADTKCSHPQVKHERGDDLSYTGACHAVVSEIVDGINEPKMCACPGFVAGDQATEKKHGKRWR